MKILCLLTEIKYFEITQYLCMSADQNSDTNSFDLTPPSWYGFIQVLDWNVGTIQVFDNHTTSKKQVFSGQKLERVTVQYISRI